ncbi:MAG: hypothetical protein BWY97_00091 [Tenericutes bacterium ADurb.BinA124]|nr:MAG: hypothetical protein BWY97_00091 [Tenericutes bacterium ADurb.BinA124]
MAINVELRRSNGLNYNDSLAFPSDWSKIQNKPTTYTPTSHQHTVKDITDGNVPYFVNGNTTGTAGVWTGTINGLTEYKEGLRIDYKIGVAGAAQVTLNINNIGAKVCYRYSTSKVTTHFGLNYIIPFVYTTLNGGCWMVVGDPYDDIGDYTLRMQNAFTAGETIYAWKIVMQGVDGKLYPLTLESGTGTTKTVATTSFLLNGVIFWHTNGPQITKNTSGGAYYFYEAYRYTHLHYTANASSGFIAFQPLYLKGTIDANGGFVLDNSTYTSWLTQTLPTSEDGKVYILLGYMNNTTTDFRLIVHHPVYQFKNGKLRLYETDDPRPASDVYAWAKAANKPSYSAAEVGAAPEIHSHTTLKSDTDNRSSNTVPNDYNYKFDIKGLKGKNAIGLPDTHAYAALLGIRGWGDASGGDAHEFAFAGSGNIYHRHGSTTSWNTWKKLAYVTDIPTDYVPTTRKVNNKALSSDITLGASDVSAVPTTRKINGKALSADISLVPSDIGAAPTHNHPYEPANANIQQHISSAHAPSNAQKNSDITKAEIEAKLTGEISTHTHSGSSIANSSIALSKLSNISNNRILGRYADSNGVPQELTTDNVKAMLGLGSAAYKAESYFAQSSHTHPYASNTHTHQYSAIVEALKNLTDPSAASYIKVDTDSSVSYKTPAQVLTDIGGAPSHSHPYLSNTHAAAGVTSTRITNWDNAYNWGNHASQGYLKSITKAMVTGTGLTYSDVSAAQNVHAHGNISSAGTIANTIIPPASGDYILVSDGSNQNKIIRSIGIGTGTTKYLREDGTWQTPAGGGSGGLSKFLLAWSNTATANGQYLQGMTSDIPGGTVLLVEGVSADGSGIAVSSVFIFPTKSSGSGLYNVPGSSIEVSFDFFTSTANDIIFSATSAYNLWKINLYKLY